MEHLPQMQEKARVLDLHITHCPAYPRPLHIADGEEMTIGVVIGHDSDRISQGDVGVYPIT
jgi:hypothetical protein